MRKHKKFKTGKRTTPAQRKNAVLSSCEFAARRKQNTLLHSELIISVKEARKLLGSDGKNMSDLQIEDLIITLTEASSMLLNQS